MSFGRTVLGFVGVFVGVVIGHNLVVGAQTAITGRNPYQREIHIVEAPANQGPAQGSNEPFSGLRNQNLTK